LDIWTLDDLFDYIDLFTSFENKTNIEEFQTADEVAQF
jgi:hypothetical protein